MRCTSGPLCRTCPLNHSQEEERKPLLKQTKMATKWLEWEANQRGIHTRHGINSTEKRIGDRRLPGDSYHEPTQTVSQFHGFRWHAHDCYLNEGKENTLYICSIRNCSSYCEWTRTREQVKKTKSNKRKLLAF